MKRIQKRKKEEVGLVKEREKNEEKKREKKRCFMLFLPLSREAGGSDWSNLSHFFL